MTENKNEILRPVELDDLFKLKTITEAKLSPGGFLCIGQDKRKPVLI